MNLNLNIYDVVGREKGKKEGGRGGSDHIREVQVIAPSDHPRIRHTPLVFYSTFTKKNVECIYNYSYSYISL